MSTYDPEQTHRERVLEALGSIDSRLAEQTGDARAQLWASVYAAEYAVQLGIIAMDAPNAVQQRNEWTEVRIAGSRAVLNVALSNASKRAADAAVADFDTHYLGGKR